ncbi:hypothetical protein GOP47_0004490 [Adiantum capillus-veneris]|uniref:Uncharacterized protein n=1 Tax=Adiantum capillus-veneris TaxID=13818 RepID=A0A9D4ZPM0_ADICA|nr:hypothetical protein GOP47_0004490 [Adiantum capillus-veneris]
MIKAIFFILVEASLQLGKPMAFHLTPTGATTIESLSIYLLFTAIYLALVHSIYQLSSYEMISYLNNTMVEHKSSTRGWAMMVRPNCVDLWKCKKSSHGSLQAIGKDLEQIFDGARSQVQGDGALSSQNCKCFFCYHR